MDIAEADKAITIWLDVLVEARALGQTDAAVEAAEALDWLLRKPVVLT